MRSYKRTGCDRDDKRQVAAERNGVVKHLRMRWLGRLLALKVKALLI